MQAQLRCKRCGALFKVKQGDVLYARACPQCGLKMDAETVEQMKKAFDSIAHLVQKKECKNSDEAK